MLWSLPLISTILSYISIAKWSLASLCHVGPFTISSFTISLHLILLRLMSALLHFCFTSASSLHFLHLPSTQASRVHGSLWYLFAHIMAIDIHSCTLVDALPKFSLHLFLHIYTSSLCTIYFFILQTFKLASHVTFDQLLYTRSNSGRRLQQCDI